MSIPHVLFASMIAALALGAVCHGGDTWKVRNRGKEPYVVRLRPASNHKAGFAIKATVPPGESKTIQLTQQGSFHLNILFLNPDGSVRTSWTADESVDLRNRIVPEEGDDLMQVTMTKQMAGSGGEPSYYQVELFRIPGVNWVDDVDLLDTRMKLIDLGAITDEDPNVDVEGGLTLGGEPIEYRVSGQPGALSLTLGGRTYTLDDLTIVRDALQKRDVVSGTYAGDDRAGEFILERRDGLPFDRFSLDVKDRGAADWVSFELGSSPTTASRTADDSGVRLDEIRGILFEFQEGLRQDQARVEARLEVLGAQLDERTTALELRLANPEIHQIMTTCVECHQSTPHQQAPRGFHALRAALPKMSERTADKMMGQAELSTEERAQFLGFVGRLKAIEPRTAPPGDGVEAPPPPLP